MQQQTRPGYQPIRNNFNDIVKEFHEIFECELLTLEASEKPILNELTQFFADCNSFTMLSSEIAKHLDELYSRNESWRRLWGSVSTQFGFSLLKYEIQPFALAQYVMEYVDISQNQHGNNVDSFTLPELAADRTGTEAFEGKTLWSTNDFWIICVFLMRLTIHQSNFYNTEILKRFPNESISKSEGASQSKGRIPT